MLSAVEGVQSSIVECIGVHCSAQCGISMEVSEGSAVECGGVQCGVGWRGAERIAVEWK